MIHILSVAISLSVGYNRFDGLAQDCIISSALAMEILQSYTKPAVYT